MPRRLRISPTAPRISSYFASRHVDLGSTTTSQHPCMPSVSLQASRILRRRRFLATAFAIRLESTTLNPRSGRSPVSLWKALAARSLLCTRRPSSARRNSCFVRSRPTVAREVMPPFSGPGSRLQAGPERPQVAIAPSDGGAPGHGGHPVCSCALESRERAGGAAF